MKKMFLAAITALALCSYGYAQDDDEEYEDEEETTEEVTKAPAVEEEEEEEEEEEAAPVQKKKEKKSKKKKKKGSDGAFVGIGLDVAGTLAGESTIQVAFKATESIVVSALIGLHHHGESAFTPAGGTEIKAEDNNTELALGIGFDYILLQEYLPVSVGGEFIYVSPTELETISPADGDYITVKANEVISLTNLKFNFLLGVQAELVKNLTLTGKVGFGIDYYSMDIDAVGEGSYLDLGFVTKAYLTWFAF